MTERMLSGYNNRILNYSHHISDISHFPLYAEAEGQLQALYDPNFDSKFETDNSCSHAIKCHPKFMDFTNNHHYMTTFDRNIHNQPSYGIQPNCQNKNEDECTTTYNLGTETYDKMNFGYKIINYQSATLPLDLSAVRNDKKDCLYDPSTTKSLISDSIFYQDHWPSYYSTLNELEGEVKNDYSGYNFTAFTNQNLNPNHLHQQQNDQFNYKTSIPPYTHFNGKYGSNPTGQFNVNVSMSMSMHIEPFFRNNELIKPANVYFDQCNVDNLYSTQYASENRQVLKRNEGQCDKIKGTFEQFENHEKQQVNMTNLNPSNVHYEYFNRKPTNIGLHELPYVSGDGTGEIIRLGNKENDVTSSVDAPHGPLDNEKFFDNDSKKSPASDFEELERLYCDYCGKGYARPSTLKTHMRTHSGERPYVCQSCGKTFSQAANLAAHARTHSGERPYSCFICHRTFSQSSSVTTHMRTHSGERPYACRHCNKKFADSSTLTKHARIHSGEKPYKCRLCSLRFSQSGNLNRHMRVHLVSTTTDDCYYKSQCQTIFTNP